MGFLWIQSMFNVDTKNAWFCVTFIQNYASAPPLNGHLGGVIFLAFRRGEGFAVLTVPI